MKSIKETHPLVNIVSNSLITLPSPSNLNGMWNFGSMLGAILVMQLATGVFLSMHYTGDVSSAFNAIDHIMRDVEGGWLARTVHANGASAFFLCMYLHMFRGMFYRSFKHMETWNIGSLILMTVMATAFLGYVLPWGQMSLWGATVITNLFSAIPFLGKDVVLWLWGGFSVDSATLTRFFSLHYLFPFIITAMVMVHLLFLHSKGSSNPMGVMMNTDKIPFHTFFSLKDLLGMLALILLLFLVVCNYPWMFGDPENFVLANPMVTPIHIQPEWYFLFAYAILRAIPSKLGGVVALLMSVVILLILPMWYKSSTNVPMFNSLNSTLLWSFLATSLLLTWIGARPVEDPFIVLGQILSASYFISLTLFTLPGPLSNKL